MVQMNELRHRMQARPSRAARMGRTARMTGALVVAAALGVTGFLAASAFAGGAGSQANATLSLRQTDLGQVLVTARGRTLYLFLKDKNGKSACSAGCATYWPPLMKTGKLTVGPGLKQALVGVTKRASGGQQVTYNKHPLYTFALDKSAGQTKGQGSSNFGAKWYAVSAKGRAVLGAPTTTSTDTTTTTTTTPYPPYP
jgi:predicted lipoprotein with Yx(FWY)xxD motif